MMPAAQHASHAPSTLTKVLCSANRHKLDETGMPNSGSTLHPGAISRRKVCGEREGA